MDKILKKLCRVNVFPILCYIISAYFLYAFCVAIGVPPSRSLDRTSGSYLAIALFLFMLPEAKRVKLGELFEYESRVKEIKDEVRQFKDETRNTLVTYASLVSAISNTVSQNITVNLPGRDEVMQAKNDLDSVAGEKIDKPKIEEEIENFVAAEGNDLNYALAVLRMRLERELRRILGKQRKLDLSGDRSSKFLSAKQLFNQFIRDFPQYGGIAGSFDYVLKVCNAAIHGHYIPDGYAHEALSMGFSMLSVLKKISPPDR